MVSHERKYLAKIGGELATAIGAITSARQISRKHGLSWSHIDGGLMRCLDELHAVLRCVDEEANP